MKLNKKNKIFGLFTLLSISFAPVFALTSCSRISQWYLPVLTGGINENDGPFNFDKTNFKDLDNNTIDYLPTNYSFYSAPSTGNASQITGYSFCSPNNLSNTEEITTYDPSWIPSNPNDPKNKFNYTTTDDQQKKIQHIDQRNLNIVTSSNAVNMISSNVSQFIDYMMFYQLHLVNSYITDKTSDLSDLNTIYGDSVDFGSKGDPVFNDFMEYNFALTNSLSGPHSKIKFGLSGCNFDFKTNKYGPGFLTSNESKDEMMAVDFPYANLNDEKTEVTGYKSIPFIFDVNDLIFSYYDPTTSDKGFLPNNWLVNDKHLVNEEMKNSPAWNKKFVEITGKEKPEASTLNWHVNLKNNKTSADGLTLSDLVSKEPVLNNLKSQITPSSFIGVATYSLSSIKNDDVETKFPVFSSVSSIYPSFFLEDSNCFKKQSEDSELYFLNKENLDQKMKDLVNSLTDRKTTPEKNSFIKYFFSDYSNNKWTANIKNILTK